MQKKIFPWVISLSALSVSGSAAFYSVYGLGKMFSGATLEVMILAGSLEFAKLVTASLLYQYWNSINKVLKTYLLIATLVLIGVTSAGIYGFLSSAHQETAFKLETQGQMINLLEQEKITIKEEIVSYQNQLDQKNNRVNQLTAMRVGLQLSQDALISQNRSTSSLRKQISGVDEEIKRIDGETKTISDSISSKNRKISSLEVEKLQISSNEDVAKEIGPLKYIAGLTGRPLDVVVNWYILVLIFVFDPLAIALVIAANFAFEKSKEDEKGQHTQEEKKESKEIHEKDKGETTEKNKLIELKEEKKQEEPRVVDVKKKNQTKKIFLETGEVKEIELEQPPIAKKEQQESSNIVQQKKENPTHVDKYTKYIMENTPGFKGYRHNNTGENLL